MLGDFKDFYGAAKSGLRFTGACAATPSAPAAPPGRFAPTHAKCLLAFGF
jgi:hypothetical protein